MRLRHIKGAEEEIAESPYVVQDPQSLKGKWHEFFGNDNPIRIEVGMGKGKFIMELCPDEPGYQLCGNRALFQRPAPRTSETRGAGAFNIYFMRIDALELADVFAEDEVERIYLNFSDPWPKDRHEAPPDIRPFPCGV